MNCPLIDHLTMQPETILILESASADESLYSSGFNRRVLEKRF
ncbi:hypothetical protein [Microcoleus sp. LEGE 07076]|nr:hypothetical protein [Microcoleus sp. LEGE 07076]